DAEEGAADGGPSGRCGGQRQGRPFEPAQVRLEALDGVARAERALAAGEEEPPFDRHQRRVAPAVEEARAAAPDVALGAVLVVPAREHAAEPEDPPLAGRGVKAAADRRGG